MIDRHRHDLNLRPGRKVAGAALMALVALGAADVHAQSRARPPAIQVDTRPLAALGARLEATRLQACLPVALSQALAGRGAPPIIVRIRAVSISAFAGMERDDDGAFGGSAVDQIEGDILVDGQRIPLLASAPAYEWLGSDPRFNTLRRIDALCEVFAGWVPSRLGLR